MAKHKTIRALRPILSIAALLLALGFGNITFGRYKAQEYSALLAKARDSVTSKPRSAEVGPFNLNTEADTRGRYLAKLHARVEFYEFVVRGGWAIAGFALISFIVGLVMWRSEAQERSELVE